MSKPLNGFRRCTIQIESSQFAPGAYWVPGAEYYAEDRIVEFPARLETLDDEALLEKADNHTDGVRYIWKASK